MIKKKKKDIKPLCLTYTYKQLDKQSKLNMF